ncbi:OPT family oligopeptide transporter [Hyalangium sp.]|uniref:OPT family oligopeptide transporter n=1 Tax=Hyalangium sp. TaxID=2028555 RepID=UPI002D4BE01A|nr:OPT family oligopeptide transporter [Hyalangium sp.]HYI02052.1 OPT family oligopeptide transporter [Hyalangium sp.]
MTVPTGPLEPQALEESSAQPATLVSVEGMVAAGGEFTPRALVAGCLIGAWLAVSNVYMGLKTGFWESGSIMAAVLGFSFLAALGRRWGSTPGVLETNLTQTAASAVGAMPAAAGLLGSLPALALMGVSVPAWSVVPWGIALGVLGVLAAHLLRRRLLVDEALPFPTGVATAEVVTAMHKAGQVQEPGRARALLGAGLGSMALTWLRDVLAWVPGMTAMPGRLAGLPASTFTWGFGWVPLALGIGMMAGLPMGLSMLLGAALGWGVLAPTLVTSQVVDSSASYEALVGWLTWPGVGLMVGAALVSLMGQARALLGALMDLRSLGSVGEGSGRWMLALALVACGAVLALGLGVFELPLLHTLLMLALVLPLCAVCARGAGQMDVAPVGQMGQLAQVASGTLVPGTAGLNVAAGSVVAGAVAPTGVSLWSLKAGLLLGASPPRQLLAQLLGVLVGAIVSVPAYLLLVKTYGLGSEALPAPSAHQFRVVAELSTQGLSGLPAYAAQAAGIGFGVGAALTLASRGRLERFLPSPVAMGIGFILPAYFAVTIAMGGLLATLARRAQPQGLGQHVSALGAGTIGGESIMGLTIALLVWLGFIQR